MNPAAVIPLVLAVVLVSAYIGHRFGYLKGVQVQPDHEWQIVGVYTPSGLTGPAKSTTVVLSRCTKVGCPELLTQQLDGVWSMADLLAGEASDEQDQAIAMVSEDGRP
jgi:hypothetical protein